MKLYLKKEKKKNRSNTNLTLNPKMFRSEVKQKKKEEKIV